MAKEEVLISLGCDNSSLNRGLVSATDHIKSWSKDLTRHVTENFAGFFGAVAVIEGARKLEEELRRISSAAKALDVSTNFLQNLNEDAQKFGISSEQIQSGLEILTKRAGENDAAFAKWKISLTNSNGTAKNTGELMADISLKMSKLTDGTQRAALASDFFGKSGTRLVPVLMEGKKAIEEFNEASANTIDAESINQFISLWDEIKDATKVSTNWLVKYLALVPKAVAATAAFAGGSSLDEMAEKIERINSKGGILLFSDEQQAAYDKIVSSLDKVFSDRKKFVRDEKFKNASPDDQENMLLEEYLELEQKRIEAQRRFENEKKKFADDKSADNAAQVAQAQLGFETASLDAKIKKSDLLDLENKHEKEITDEKKKQAEAQGKVNQQMGEAAELSSRIKELQKGHSQFSTVDELAHAGWSPFQQKARRIEFLESDAKLARQKGNFDFAEGEERQALSLRNALQKVIGEDPSAREIKTLTDEIKAMKLAGLKVIIPDEP